MTGDSAHGFTLTNLADRGTSRRRAGTAASGCSTYPEAQVDATGNSFAGASPEATVSGTVEGHAHITAFEFLGGDWHCGRPWSPFGAPYALPASCAGDEKGTNGVFEAFLDFGGVTRPGVDERLADLQVLADPDRDRRGGRLLHRGSSAPGRPVCGCSVTNDVDNEALCSLMTTRRNPCNDMASVKIQGERPVRAPELHRRAVGRPRARAGSGSSPIRSRRAR